MQHPSSTTTGFLSRRRFLAQSASIGAGLAGKAAVDAAGKLSGGKRNVILIISDTMRRDALGCYGGRWVETPNLDAFARQSVQFDHAYLCSFPTVPARHDILTGSFTFTFKSWSPLDKDTVTLQDVLRGAGVYTALVVDTPHPFTPEYNYQRNFDHAEVIRGQEHDLLQTKPIPVRLPCDPKKLREGTKTVTQYLRNVADRKTEEDYFCARTLRTAGAWLEKNHRRQPFFLYVDTFDPHEPWDPPASYVRKYDPGYQGEEVIYPRYDRWKDYLTPAELKHCRALYAGEASLVDHWTGQLLQKIERLGLLDNTLILFVADHGFYLGEHGYIGKSLIRGNKFQSLPLYSEIARIPLLCHFPGCRPGTRCQTLVQTVDLASTILEFLDVKAPPTFAAPSLWQVFQGNEEKVRDAVISAPNLSYPGMRHPQPSDRATITDGRWLLIYGCAGTGDANDHTASVDSRERLVSALEGKKLEPELYNLDGDPACLKNVIASEPDIARQLHRHFTQFLRRSPMQEAHQQYFRNI